jgi:spermidine synthase
MLRHVILVAGLLFGSGMCALIYQMVWLREFRFVFGASYTGFGGGAGGLPGGLGVEWILVRAPRRSQ